MKKLMLFFFLIFAQIIDHVYKLATIYVLSIDKKYHICFHLKLPFLQPWNIAVYFTDMFA